MKKILIIGPAWVGDMVMAQSLFKLIKTHEICEIDVIAPTWTIPILERMPEISRAIPLPLTHGKFALKKRWKIGKSLRPHHYDQCILTTRSWKSALIPFFAKIRLRTSWLGEYRYGLINDVRPFDKKRYPLMIERFALLGPLKENFIQPLPLPQLELNLENQLVLKEKWKINNTQPILALCPGAEFGPAKRWPVQYFAEVAQYYLQKNWQIILLGSNKDSSLAREINEVLENAAINLCGEIKLADAVDILGLCTAVVSNDSGLMHIACSLNRPTLVIYGSTAATFTPPLSEKAKGISLGLECSPCFKRQCPLQHMKCLNDLLPTKIIDELEEMLAKA